MTVGGYYSDQGTLKDVSARIDELAQGLTVTIKGRESCRPLILRGFLRARILLEDRVQRENVVAGIHDGVQVLGSRVPLSIAKPLCGVPIGVRTAPRRGKVKVDDDGLVPKDEVATADVAVNKPKPVEILQLPSNGLGLLDRGGGVGALLEGVLENLARWLRVADSNELRFDTADALEELNVGLALGAIAVHLEDFLCGEEDVAGPVQRNWRVVPAAVEAAQHQHLQRPSEIAQISRSKNDIGDDGACRGGGGNWRPCDAIAE